jgi:predicted alpha/beta superfamily hydrolase
MGQAHFAVFWLLAVQLMTVLPQAQAKTTLADGKIVIGETITVHSKHLNRGMTIDVCLPQDYAAGNKRYPLLLTCQSHFLHISGIAADLARRGSAPEMIVAGVRNYSSDDFIPEKISGHPYSGGADRFISFFHDELIPNLDRRYRTRPFRIFYSGSFGGGFAVYAFLTRPDVFNACLAAAPAIDYEGGSNLIMSNARSWLAQNAYRNRFLYMGVENEPRLIPLLERLSSLIGQAAPPGLRWRYRPYLDEDHTSIVNQVVHHGLRFVFSATSDIPADIIGRGSDAIREYAAGLAAAFGYDIGLTDIAFHRAVNAYMEQERINDAIGLLHFQLQFKPDAELAWLSLGRAYEANGQLAAARTALRYAREKAMANSSPHLGIFTAALDQIEQKLAKQPEAK